MSYQDKQQAKVRLTALRLADETKKAIAKAKNDLESFIYNTRAVVNDGRWDEVSIETQRDQLFNALSEAEEWLYEQRDDHADIFTDKLQSLKQLSEPIKLRESELAELPKAVGASFNIFNLSKTQVADYPTTRPWVRAVDLEQLANLTRDGEEWLAEQLVHQHALSKHEQPVLTSVTIYQKLMPIADLSAQLMKVRKPPEAPKPKSSTKAGKAAGKNKTTVNETEGGVDGAENAEGEVDADTNDASGDARKGEAESANGGVEPEIGEDEPIPQATQDTHPGYDEL